MSILRLSSSTSSLITSSYSIPSFENAVHVCVQSSISTLPHAITVTLHPQALRFTVVDDGPAISQTQFNSALLPSSSLSPIALSSLANTSTIELRIRTQQFSALKTISASKTLENRIISNQNASSLLPKPGMQIDVWETFHATPVRRRIEQHRSSNSIIQSVRECIACLALCNPRISFTLRIDNNVVILRTPRASQITLDHVSVAFDDVRAVPWLSFSVMYTGISIIAFLSRPGLPHTRCQLVSVDGFNAPGSCTASIFSRAWRAWFGRCNGHTNSRRFPAFVVNVNTGFRRPVNAMHGFQCRHPLAESGDLDDKTLAQLVFKSVMGCLSGQQTDTADIEDSHAKFPRASEQLPKTEKTKAVVETRKRKRFEDAEITPHPIIANTERCNFNSDSSISLLPSSTPRLSSKRSGLSAVEIEGVFKEQVPGWCDTCIISSKRVEYKREEIGTGLKSDKSDDVLDKRRVNISKNCLKEMKVIGQVDCKFIIVINNDSSTMYAMDQHAVSERILYEQLVQKAEIEGMKSKSLKNLMEIKVSQIQKHVIKEKIQSFEKWGWRIDEIHDDDDQVNVSHVPRICGLNVSDVVLDGTDGFIAFVDEVVDGSVSIPRVLIECMASVACHSAVRFGDRLSKKQCESLVLEGLGQCDNPFVCAHGRPSVVPLVVFQYDDG